MTWLYGKLQAYAAVAGALVLAVAYAFLRGRSAGKAAITESLSKENQKVADKFHEIDNKSVSVDGAFDSLRNRTNRG